MSGSAPFSKEELLEEFDHDLELVSRCLELFRGDCAVRLPRINQAIEKGDSKAVADQAHAIKSGVGNFFASGAYQAATDLETGAADAQADELQKAAQNLDREIQQLMEALEAVCDSA